MKFPMRIVVTAIALWAATRLVTGITFQGHWLGLVLTSGLSSKFGIDFHVASFWPAIWGAIVVGIVSFMLSILFPDGERPAVHE